jgi:hypothetical protein
LNKEKQGSDDEGSDEGKDGISGKILLFKIFTRLNLYKIVIEL